MECYWDDKLRITTNPRKLFLGTKYNPEYLTMTEILKITDIDRSTILKWCREGKLEHRYGQQAGAPTIIKTESFVNYVLRKYRYSKFSGRRGKWWSAEEIKNLENKKTDRSSLACRIKKHRIRKGDTNEPV